MEATVYAVEAEVERTHWWFVNRRRLFGMELKRAGLAGEARTLDVGSGTGSNLRLLRDLGYRNVVGLDASDDAIRYCAEKGLPPVRRGDVCALPFPDASFDLVMATDIIEHVDDDGQALRELRRVMAPSGVLLLTVPAFASLWGLQDRVSMHKRRYRMKPLLQLLRRSGLGPLRSYYFNYLLFAPIWLARRAIDALGIKLSSEGEVNSPLLNTVLSGVFAVDVATARVLHPPFGVSILVIARRSELPT
jgi:SAM-dependent methyltransferase